MFKEESVYSMESEIPVVRLSSAEENLLGLMTSGDYDSRELGGRLWLGMRDNFPPYFAWLQYDSVCPRIHFAPIEYRVTQNSVVTKDRLGKNHYKPFRDLCVFPPYAYRVRGFVTCHPDRRAVFRFLLERYDLYRKDYRAELQRLVTEWVFSSRQMRHNGLVEDESDKQLRGALRNLLDQ